MQHLSKFLSLILRHKPESVGLTLDPNGWVNVDKLLVGMQESGKRITLNDLEFIVADDNKGRYSFNQDKTMIRANQGHSISVDLGLIEKTPPPTLYHGTPDRFEAIIRIEGLKPMQRHHVHLSDDITTAKQVGSRRGTPFIFHIDTRLMIADNIKFYQSENGVWLVDYVAPKYFMN